jgi:DNA-binding XRE family transcriptional regulator
MRYDTIISYQNKRVTIKVTNKAYSGNFVLPDFLKAVRIAKRQDYAELCNLSSRWKTHDCMAYENGELPIPRGYISFFCIWYSLPLKLINLGVPDEQHKENPLALRLREIRLTKGDSQEQCAFKINVAQSTYAGYEVGRSTPDIQTLIKFADAYETSLDYLCGRYDRRQ